MWASVGNITTHLGTVCDCRSELPATTSTVDEAPERPLVRSTLPELPTARRLRKDRKHEVQRPAAALVTGALIIRHAGIGLAKIHYSRVHCFREKCNPQR